MNLNNFARSLAAAASFASLAATAPALAAPQLHTQALVGGPPAGPALLPTGQYVTALAAPGSFYMPLRTGFRPDTNADANGAVTTALAPDGKTLLVLTSGYNYYFTTTSGAFVSTPYVDPRTGRPAASTDTSFQFVFVFDVSSGVPKKLQQLLLPNAYDGLAWDPGGRKFYVSGGQDDRICIYKRGPSGFIPDAPFAVLGHNSNDELPEPTYDGGILKYTRAGSAKLVQTLGLNFGAMTAGVAVSADGKYLFAANLQDDSLSVVDAATRRARDVRLYQPGSLTARGEFPYWVQPHSARARGPVDKVYVTSARDGEVVALATSGRMKFIAVGGEPGKMLLAPDGRSLYVVNPDLDEIEIIDTHTDDVRSRISVMRAGYRYRGASPNSLALSPDGSYLYTTLAGENAVGVIDLRSARLIGRIPTGWYPSSVTVSADGTRLFVAVPKSEAGPAPTLKGYYTPPAYPNPTALQQYVYNTEKAGLLTIPVPDGPTLGYLSALVDANDGFFGQTRSPMMAYLHRRIHHVIYIQKENRTYDQILGDLGEGNGEPSLVEFPQPVTPNNHALALRFGDLDNWYMAGDVSGDGWNWSQQGHANDYTAKSVPVDYAGGGFDFEWNGYVRNLNLAAPVFGPPTLTGERMTTLADPSGSSTIEPGPKDIAATVGADDDRPGQTGGYIWDTALRAGLSVRHYGLYVDETFYVSPRSPYDIPIDRYAYRDRRVQAEALRPALVGRTDPYYRGWDLNVPDEYRYEEWKREFDLYVKRGDFPSLEVLDIMNDHFGATENVSGLNTPTLEMASNDHAIGQIVDAVSHSRYWNDTAIFILEDDSQDGPDHVDAHRSVGFVISPYSYPGVVHTEYNTTSMLHTMEDILGMDYLGLNDANALPMDDAFTTRPNFRPYEALVPGVLCHAPVAPDLVPACHDPSVRKTPAVPLLHDAGWWRTQLRRRKMRFDRPDENDAAGFNRLVWTGVMGANKPYPVRRGEVEAGLGQAPEADEAR